MAGGGESTIAQKSAEQVGGRKKDVTEKKGAAFVLLPPWETRLSVSARCPFP